MKEAFFKFITKIALIVLAYIYRYVRRLSAIIYLKIAKLKGDSNYGEENKS